MEYFLFFLQNCWRCRGLFDGDHGIHDHTWGRRFPSPCSLPRLSLAWPCHCRVLKYLSPDLKIPVKLASGRFCCVGLRWESASTVRNPMATGQFYSLPLWWPDLWLLRDFQIGDSNFSEHSLPVAVRLAAIWSPVTHQVIHTSLVLRSSM